MRGGLLLYVEPRSHVNAVANIVTTGVFASPFHPSTRCRLPGIVFAYHRCSVRQTRDVARGSTLQCADLGVVRATPHPHGAIIDIRNVGLCTRSTPVS